MASLSARARRPFKDDKIYPGLDSSRRLQSDKYAAALASQSPSAPSLTSVMEDSTWGTHTCSPPAKFSARPQADGRHACATCTNLQDGTDLLNCEDVPARVGRTETGSSNSSCCSCCSTATSTTSRSSLSSLSSCSSGTGMTSSSLRVEVVGYPCHPLVYAAHPPTAAGRDDEPNSRVPSIRRTDAANAGSKKPSHPSAGDDKVEYHHDWSQLDQCDYAETSDSSRPDEEGDNGRDSWCEADVESDWESDCSSNDDGDGGDGRLNGRRQQLPLDAGNCGDEFCFEEAVRQFSLEEPYVEPDGLTVPPSIKRCETATRPQLWDLGILPRAVKSAPAVIMDGWQLEPCVPTVSRARRSPRKPRRKIQGL